MQGRITRIGVQQRETRSDPPHAVQEPRQRAAPQQQQRAAPPMVPQRMQSQRILLKKLSAPWFKCRQ